MRRKLWNLCYKHILKLYKTRCLLNTFTSSSSLPLSLEICTANNTHPFLWVHFAYIVVTILTDGSFLLPYKIIFSPLTSKHSMLCHNNPPWSYANTTNPYCGSYCATWYSGCGRCLKFFLMKRKGLLYTLPWQQRRNVFQFNCLKLLPKLLNGVGKLSKWKCIICARSPLIIQIVWLSYWKLFLKMFCVPILLFKENEFNIFNLNYIPAHSFLMKLKIFFAHVKWN